MHTELKTLKAKEQVLMDIHDALGVKWGDDPYAVIRELKHEASLYRFCRKALDEIGEVVTPGVTFKRLSDLVEKVRQVVNSDDIDAQNTLAAIADPDDYENPGQEKTAELCRQLAAACMARLNP